MLSRFSFVLLGCLSAMAGTPASAGVFLRWNHAGYSPTAAKVVLAMSDTDLRGEPWRVEQIDTLTGPVAVLRGRFEASVTGAGNHAPLPFNHLVALDEIEKTGVYRLVAGDDSAEFQISRDPYARWLELPLRHLRVMRSGSDEALLRKLSHPGDARAPVYVPEGDPAQGKWKPAAPARTVDVLGGWYDAGDQIKFTLNIAYTSYHLLLAYRLAPELFRQRTTRSGLPDVLDEARHGLEFLMRVHPDAETFVIQVADARDHNQPERLPENDPLDGQRPALCALSRPHMGAAAAALALGARTFRQIGREDEAARYAAQARAIYARARQPDTLACAFERDEVNDFYRDPTDADQLALAAVELYELTGEPEYLTQAKAYAPPAATEVSWSDWNWLPNLALAPHDPAARERLLDETHRYAEHAQRAGQPWGIPGRYVWGSLHRWIGAANAARMTSRECGPQPELDRLFAGIVDYVFGRNNWGVSFLFTPELPNTLRHLYSPAYKLLGAFPTGALSEGPGNRSTHDALARYFKISAEDPFHRFNTPAAVFFDNDTDFMCQEATIGGQADGVLLLTLAALEPVSGSER